MIVETDFLTDYSLLLLRILVAIILFSSGKGHAANPEKRGKSMGMSANMALVLGIVEMIAAVSIALGLFAQVGAAIIVLVMAGAVYKKIVEWKQGFYAEEGFGWHYDFLILVCSLVIFTTAGGNFILI